MPQVRLRLEPYDPAGDLRRRAAESHARIEADLRLERAAVEAPKLDHLPANVNRRPNFKTEADRQAASKARAAMYRKQRRHIR